MPDSAKAAEAESGARADWQACTTHAFLLDHRTSCTVFTLVGPLAVQSLSTRLSSRTWQGG